MAYGEQTLTTPEKSAAVSFLSELNAGVPTDLRPLGVSDQLDDTFYDRLEAAAWLCRRAPATLSPDGFLFVSASDVRDLRRKVRRDKRARLQSLPPAFRYGTVGMSACED